MARVIPGLMLLVLGFGGVFSTLLVTILGEREADRRSAHSMQMLAAEEAVERHLLDLNRTERGFIATNDPELLEAWQRERAALTSERARLERLADTPDQARQTRRVTQASQSYIRDYATPLLQAAQRGDPVARSPTTLRQGERRVAGLRAELDRLATRERHLATERDQHARIVGDRAVTTAGAVTAAMLLIGIAVVTYLARVVVQPVRRTAAMTGQLAQGQLDIRVPETGAGEVGDLTRSVNTMGDALRHRVEQLARDAKAHTAVRRIATEVAHDAAPAEVLAAVATELGELIGTDAAHIVRYETDGTATVIAAWDASGDAIPVGTRLPLHGRSVTATVAQTGRTARMHSHTDAPGPIAAHLRAHHVRAAVGAPIFVEGRLWGAVNATATREPPLPPDAEARLADCTDLIATAIANAQARAELAASRARTVAAADLARRQIEHNLHDSIQHLIAIAIEAGGTASDLPPDLPQRRRMSAITEKLTAVLDDLRETSRHIHPTLLSDLGLRPALKGLARRCNIPVEFDVGVDRRLPEPVEIAAYHIAAEALTNAARHAHATHVRLDAAVQHGRLHLTVRDDGIGGADPAHGTGLRGLADRVEALGGSITISSPRSQGTTLHAELPLELPIGPPPPSDRRAI